MSDFSLSFRLLILGAVLLGGSVCVSSSLYAQQRYIKSFSVEDGLSHPAVRDILQDERGYLWLAQRSGGATRFDGHTFKTFSVKDGLPHNEVNVLHEDSTGVLWFGTVAGIASYDGQTVKAFTKEDGLPFEDIRAISGGPKGRLWFASYENGVFSYTGSRFEPLDENHRLKEIRSLAARGDTLWIGTAFGLYRYDGSALTRVHFGPEKGYPAEFIVGLSMGRDGTLWVGSGQGVFRYRDTFRRLAGTDSLVAHDVQRLSDGSIWIGAAKGLFRHADGETKRATPKLAGKGVKDLFRDREQNLWIGTFSQGLYKHTPNPFDHFTKADGLPSNEVGAVLRRAEGELWVGTENGLSRYDGISFTKLWKREVLNGTVSELHRVGTDSLLIGTEGSLSIYNGDTLTSHTIWDEPFTGVHDIQRGASGTYWIATNRGLARYQGGSFTRYTTKEGLSHNSVTALEIDEKGRLWIGYEKGGVDQYQKGSFTRLEAIEQIPEQARVSDILVDSSGYAWLSTRIGIYVKPPPGAVRSDSLRHVSGRDGLTGNNVHCLLLDRNGYLWAGTSTGVNRLDIRAFRQTGEIPIRRYGQDEGFVGMTVLHAYQDPQGPIWFGTAKGLTRYSPSEDSLNEVEPFPRVVDVRSFSETLNWSRYADGRTPWEHLPAGVRLPHNMNGLTFRYVGLSFRAPEQVAYKFKLKGLDKQWSPVTEQRQATYTNLPPGSYTFKVKAANSDGVWSGQAASYSFTITPPFWRTTWFYVLCGVVLAGGIIGVVRWRTRTLERRQQVLEETVVQRTRELAEEKEKTEQQAERLKELDEAKSRFFANVSHEFRTPLTLILGPVRDLREKLRRFLAEETVDRIGADEQLSVVERNARRLLRLVDQLLGIARMEAGTYQLEARPTDVGAEVERVARTFEPLAEREGLTLTVETNEKKTGKRPVYVDHEALEHVLSNLLSNAIKFTPEEGRVTLRVRESADEVEIAVADTGPGIPPSEQDKVFDRFRQVDGSPTREQEGAGIGLAFVKDLVDLHGGHVAVDSTPGEGSTFIIRLPKGRAHLSNEQVAEEPEVEERDDETTAEVSPPSSPVASAEFSVHEDVQVEGEDGAAEEPSSNTAASLDTAQGKQVLVVDDNAEMRRYVRSVLEPTFSVLEAASGEEGLATAREELPDVILADVMMPDLDGHEMTRRLKDCPETEAIPVIMVTARAGTEDEIEGLQVGADDYVTKPFDADVLRQRVGGVITLQERLRRRLHAALQQETGTEEIGERSEVEEKARQVIREHLTDPTFDAKSLAERMGMSRSTLYKQFDEQAEGTPLALITELRMEKATELLEEGEGSVTQVAYAVGYERLSSFSHAYKKHTGQPPSSVLTKS